MGQAVTSGGGRRRTAQQIDGARLSKLLMEWYRTNRRALPWRGSSDPYAIWVSETMLQQTRVSTVIEYYTEFVRRFPTLISLALATEPDVLAAWSGLGYYNRARMLHRAAQFIVAERNGRLPSRSAELRTLPGIGEYTASAIASIAFGERVAAVDGNVERVILRLTGRVDDATAATRGFVRTQAQALMMKATGTRSRPEKSDDDANQPPAANAAGDHNQAMMELGAMICLPHAPLCSQCPVYDLCRTRGEHTTPPRDRQRCLPAACLLDLRKRGPVTEVLLEHRSATASIMPAMYELPPLPVDAVEGLEPALRLRHAITNTNYYVQVFSLSRHATASRANSTRTAARQLRRPLTEAGRELHWTRTSGLASLPLTGLARKILQRLKVMENPRVILPE